MLKVDLGHAGRAWRVRVGGGVALVRIGGCVEVPRGRTTGGGEDHRTITHA